MSPDQADPFATWIALVAAADAGDEKALAFLRMYGPWMEARLKCEIRH